MASTLPDRRAALKARHRAAIVSAARELIAERGGPSFGVDDLAARADVARRTVFNHFSGLDDVLLTVCEEVLDVVVDDFLTHVASTPVGNGNRSAMFDELAYSLRSADLPTVIATIGSILGAEDVSASGGSRSIRLNEAAFARVSTRLVGEVVRRNPGGDPLDAELLVSSLMSGLTVIASHWRARSGDVVDDATRAEWEHLLTRLLDSVRSGYLPT